MSSRHHVWTQGYSHPHANVVNKNSLVNPSCFVSRSPSERFSWFFFWTESTHNKNTACHNTSFSVSLPYEICLFSALPLLAFNLYLPLWSSSPSSASLSLYSWWFRCVTRGIIPELYLYISDHFVSLFLSYFFFSKHIELRSRDNRRRIARLPNDEVRSWCWHDVLFI